MDRSSWSFLTFLALASALILMQLLIEPSRVFWLIALSLVLVWALLDRLLAESEGHTSMDTPWERDY